MTATATVPDTTSQRTATDRGPSRAGTRSCAVALGAAAAIATMLAGCGSAAGPARSRPASADSSAGSRPQAYADCMRAHGETNFPNPVDGHITLTPASRIDPSSPTFQAAFEACASLAPSGPPPSAAARGTSTDGQPTTAAWRSFAGWLGQRAAAGEFSGAVLVAHHGTPLLDAGYGLADRQAGTPNTPQTKFCIASIGKLFTAVAIAQLVEQHKLSFAATIGRYISGLPAVIADHVTIAQLLTMTSGLDDVVLSRPNHPTTLPAMVRLIATERPQFKPGTRFLYSNDGYILLGAIIQKASGESYASYLRQHIFEPAGMTHTDVRTYAPARVPDMAHGYTLVQPNGHPLLPTEAPATGSPSQPATLRDNSTMPHIANPSGGAYSTVGDLLAFARALIQHKLVSAAMTAIILKPRVDSPQLGGPPVDQYTYGFAYQAINGVTCVGHNGGTPGYEGQLDIYPQNGYVVVILTNQDQVMVPAIRQTEAILTRS